MASITNQEHVLSMMLSVLTSMLALHYRKNLKQCLAAEMPKVLRQMKIPLVTLKKAVSSSHHFVMSLTSAILAPKVVSIQTPSGWYHI